MFLEILQSQQILEGVTLNFEKLLSMAQDPNTNRYPWTLPIT